MNQEKIGKFIADIRKEKNLTQEELAEQLGITKNAISKWERGLCLMNISLLKPLSKILEVEVIDILSGEIINPGEKEKKYETLLLKLFGNRNLNKRKIKFQYYLFEIIIFLLTITIATLSNKEIITILAIILMVVANTFNLVFYILIKDVNYLMNVKNKS